MESHFQSWHIFQVPVAGWQRKNLAVSRNSEQEWECSDVLRNLWMVYLQCVIEGEIYRDYTRQSTRINVLQRGSQLILENLLYPI